MRELNFTLKEKSDVEEVVSVAKTAYDLSLAAFGSLDGKDQEYKYRGRLIALIATTPADGEITIIYRLLSKGVSESNPDFNAIERWFHIDGQEMAQLGYTGKDDEQHLKELFAECVSADCETFMECQKEGKSLELKAITVG